MMALRTRLISATTSILSRLRPTAPPLPSQPRRILILKLCCLGDVLLTTPLVGAIRQHYPAAQITYAVGPWSRPMLSTSPDIDQLWTLPERWTISSFTAVLRSLRQQKFDLVFVPERSPIPSALVALAQIPVRIGLDSRGRGFGYTHPVPVPPSVIHEADLYNLLGRVVGITNIPRRLSFMVPASSQHAAVIAKAALHSISGPFVILHPGGGANPGMILARKRWLPERWAVIADHLITTQGATILIVGGPGDETAVAAVQQAMQQPAVQRVERWNWQALAALIQQAQLFLGHDTGMMHLACAVGTPTLAVFGPSDPQMYGPYNPASHAVWRPTPASPCFIEGAAPADCPCDYQCMRNISALEVQHAAESLLGVSLDRDQ